MAPRRYSSIFAAAAAILALGHAEPLPSRHAVSFRSPFEIEMGGVHNINVEYTDRVDGELALVYGSCGISSISEAHHQVGRTHIGSHPLAKRHLDWESQRPTKFVWIIPSEVSSGCLHAFSDGILVGRSETIEVTPAKLRRRGTFADVTDAMGPWFDGVAYLDQKQPDEAFVASVKNKTFGVLGAGISGLMTSLLLDSVGIKKWKIIESSERLGGRIRTHYLNNTTPEEGQYHELGPMRFPYTLTNSDTNETYPFMDSQLVFQLAEKLNKLNGGDKDLAVDFIPWIQNADNTPITTKFRRPDGTWPGKNEIAANPNWATNTTYSDPAEAEEAKEALEAFKGLTDEKIKEYATNVFRAHKQAVEEGLFDFSEIQYLRQVVGTSLNVSDEVASSAATGPMWEYDTGYFLATEWKTIRGGLNHLPNAFRNIVKDRISYNSKVHSLKYDSGSNTVSVSHRPTKGNPLDTTSTTETFDYVLNSVPFNLQRFWDLPPYSSLLSRAIDRLEFTTAAKVAIQYDTRFWEHLDHPIFGGCGRVSAPRIGQICFPAWQLNSTGPGVLLASYISGSDATAACAMTEEQHVAYVQRAVVDIFGKVAEDNWTGNYARQCWAHDENHGGSWASPVGSQQPLYLPAYWQTEFNTVVIGEHTSFTHAWIFSALESAVRGTVQLLLDLGLVDEAKEITKTWMARWIRV
ncbi:hypothetical protein V2G26_001618 [Clonostachys chloroleuca]